MSSVPDTDEVLNRYSPVEPSVVDDPFPAYAALRSACPMHRHDGMAVPLHTVSRHADVTGVLVGNSLWSNRDGPGVGVSGAGSVGDMQHDDEPEHQRRRRLALDWFMPSAVRRLEPDLRALAESLADDMGPRGRADLYEDFALPMPVSTICSLLGVELDDRARFVHWADELTIGMAYPDRSRVARAELSAHTAAEVDHRRDLLAAGEPLPPGLLSHLTTAPWEPDGTPMPTDEIVGMVNQLILAGHETTTSLITNCVWRLLERREELWERVVADPGLIPAAVEESLRYDAPVLGVCRTNLTPVELLGVALPERSKLMMLFASANRDEAMFEAPDDFRLDRPPSEAARHLAFGFGVHHCLGSRLARLSGRVALETLVARFPDMRLAGPTKRIPSPFLWGRKHLPVVW
jgi:cytochrome P450